ncbi:hypothetical protein LINPERPRIM_LOCUS1988 [Linum perenne]
MGRHVGDSSTMVNSSIALLQERFKELQRVKEKRQEKELLKLFSESSERHINTASPPTPSSSSSPSPSSSKHFDPSSYDDHMSIFLNHRSTPSPPRVSRYQKDHPSSLLSLGLSPSSSSENKMHYSSYDHHQPLIRGVKNNQASLWASSRASSPSSSSRTSFGHSDVDTSLRL